MDLTSHAICKGQFRLENSQPLRGRHEDKEISGEVVGVTSLTVAYHLNEPTKKKKQNSI